MDVDESIPTPVSAPVYQSRGIPMALGILYGHAMEGWHDNYACEIRYRDVRERLRDMSERIAQVEQDQRTFVDLLRDVRELIRRVAARLQALEHRIEEIAGRSDRITRHFGN